MSPRCCNICGVSRIGPGDRCPWCADAVADLPNMLREIAPAECREVLEAAKLARWQGDHLVPLLGAPGVNLASIGPHSEAAWWSRVHGETERHDGGWLDARRHVEAVVVADGWRVLP